MPRDMLDKGRRSSALLVLAALAPLAVLAAILAMVAIYWQGRTTEADAQSQAHLLRLSVDRFVDNNFTALQLLASSPRLDPGSENLAAFHDIASRAVADVKAWDQVILLDLSGQQVVNTIVPYGTPLPRAVDMQSFEEILRTRSPVVSGISEQGNFVARQRRIGFRVPVVRNGEMIYVLTGVFTPDRFSGLIDLPATAQGWRPFLADARGNLVVAPHSPLAQPGMPLQKGGLEARAAKSSGSYRSQTREGEPTITVFSKSAHTGWSAHIGIPESIFNAPMRRFQIVLASAGVLALTCTGLFIWLLKRESESRAQAVIEAEHTRRLEALGRVAGGVAHDFNNLLTAILSSLRSLHRGNRTGERADRLLDTAIMAAERGATLTQRLLSFSRKPQLSAEPVSVMQAFTTVERLFAHATHGIAFRTEVSPDVGVHVDRAQFEATLLNLCSNARDAMPDGGSLTLKAMPARAADRVCVTITDTGTGMDKATAERALEPFFSTKGSRGTGLGLWSAHTFAQQSGGELSLDTAPGRGTTVTLVLPACDIEPAVIRATEPRPPRAQAILAVDDDPLVLLGTRSMLEELGYDVVTAYSGAEAIEQISVHPVDIVLTDYRMPGLSGLELADRIRQLHPNLPVLIYSGYAEIIECEICYPVISKPADPEALARILADKLQRPRPPDVGRAQA